MISWSKPPYAEAGFWFRVPACFPTGRPERFYEGSGSRAVVVAVMVGEVVIVTHSNKYYMGSQTPKVTCPEAFNNGGCSERDLTVPKTGQAPPSPESLVLYEFRLKSYKIETLNPTT